MALKIRYTNGPLAGNTAWTTTTHGAAMIHQRHAEFVEGDFIVSDALASASEAEVAARRLGAIARSEKKGAKGIAVAAGATGG